jgi:RNA polymerase sigma-70 factor (ECF subfamily)
VNVLPHETKLRGYLRNRFSDCDLDDVVQEAYLRVWKAHVSGSLRHVRSFLFTAARNVAVDAARRRRASPFEEVERDYAYSVPAEQPTVAEWLSRQQERGLLAAAVADLPNRCRETFVLRRFDGLTYRQIALRLGISPRTAEHYVEHGNRRCVEYLQIHGIDQ